MNSDLEMFVISLEGAQARRRHMLQELSGIAHKWFFFDAIKIDRYPDCYDKEYRRRWFGFDLTLGEIGCFLSHRKLWEKCVNSENMLLILEDDIKLSGDIDSAINFARKNNHRFGILRLMQLQKRRGYQVFTDGEIKALTFHEQPSGAQGYFITPNAAKVLLNYTRIITEPVDNMMDHYWRTGIDVFCIDPPVIEDAKLTSEIGSRGWRKRPKWQGLKRDLRTGLTEIYRRYYNYKKYKKIIL